MKRRRKKRSPRTSPVAMEATSDGWRVVLSPAGISRAAHGIFWVGLCFCVGLALITAAFVVFPHIGSTQGGVYTPPRHQPVPALVFVVLGGFWIAALGTVLFGINLGLRRGSIEITPDVLRIQQLGVFGKQIVELPRSSVVAVQCGPTGLSVGATKGALRSGAAGRGVDELHVYTEDGARLRFFAGRASGDLDSLASALREALRVGTTVYDGG